MRQKIIVLLSTYNGEKYLEEQLKSIFLQEDVEVQMFVRDDGSKDSTCEILKKWADIYPIIWYQGENIGPAQSFMDLICKAPQGPFYALCDQDDIWDRDKLKAAVGVLENMTQEKPRLYFCNYRMVDKYLNILNEKVTFRTMSFGNSLIQNIALGCSMVFNTAVKDLAILISTSDESMHDAWLYKLCYATGSIYYDDKPHLSYRQHDANVVGGQRGLLNKWKRRKKRIAKVWNGRISAHIKVFQKYCEGYITDNDKRKTLSLLTNYKDSYKNKLALLLSKDIILQSKIDTLFFKLMVFIGRI